MKEPGAKAAAVLAIACLALLGIALFQSFERYRAVLLWKKVDATVLERKIAFRRDGDGMLLYRIRVALQYSTPSGRQSITAESDLESADFAVVRSRTNQYAPGSNVSVYYDPARHDKVRFGAEFSSAYLGETLYYYTGSVLLGIAGVLIRSGWKARGTCAGCPNKLKQHYRYCPFCGASRSTSAHLIGHERTVET